MKKKLIIVLTFLFALLLIGCKGGNDNPPVDGFNWAGKEATKISVVKDKLAEEYDLEEFTIGMITVKVEFSDGSSHEFTCDDSHFALSKEITTVGKPKIQIICTDETAKFTITIVSYTTQDTRAIEAANNAIVAKRNGDKIDFVVAKTTGLASGQLQYSYNTEKMTLGEVTRGSAAGYVNVEVKDGKISLGFANDENLEEGAVICSIAYTGDYRNSELAINEEFENTCWMVAQDAPVLVADVTYHVSRK